MYITITAIKLFSHVNIFLLLPHPCIVDSFFFFTTQNSHSRSSFFDLYIFHTKCRLIGQRFPLHRCIKGVVGRVVFFSDVYLYRKNEYFFSFCHKERKKSSANRIYSHSCSICTKILINNDNKKKKKKTFVIPSARNFSLVILVCFHYIPSITTYCAAISSFLCGQALHTTKDKVYMQLMRLDKICIILPHFCSIQMRDKSQPLFRTVEQT